MFKGSTIVILLNTIAGAGALGVLVYTQMMFKRPAITEKQERERINEEKIEEITNGEKGTVTIDSINMNIKPTSYIKNGVKKTKEHFARFSIAFEIRDINQQDAFEEVKPIFMDKLIAHLGDKTFDSLTSVQGRYLLRSELIVIANKLVHKPLFSNAYFTEFIVQ